MEIYAVDLVLLGDVMETIELNTKALMKDVKEVGIEINTGKIKIGIWLAVESGADIEPGEEMFEAVEKFRYLGSTITWKRKFKRK